MEPCVGRGLTTRRSADQPIVLAPDDPVTLARGVPQARAVHDPHPPPPVLEHPRPLQLLERLGYPGLARNSVALPGRPAGRPSSVHAARDCTRGQSSS